MTSYEEILKAINQVPVTYLPGLLGHIVRSCVKRKIFINSEALVKVVRNAIRREGG